MKKMKRHWAAATGLMRTMKTNIVFMSTLCIKKGKQRWNKINVDVFTCSVAFSHGNVHHCDIDMSKHTQPDIESKREWEQTSLKKQLQTMLLHYIEHEVRRLNQPNGENLKFKTSNGWFFFWTKATHVDASNVVPLLINVLCFSFVLCTSFCMCVFVCVCTALHPLLLDVKKAYFKKEKKNTSQNTKQMCSHQKLFQ